MKKIKLNDVRSRLFELNCCEELVEYPAFWCYQNNTALGISNSSEDCYSFMYFEVEYDYDRELVKGIDFVVKGYSKEALNEDYVFTSREEQIRIIKAINRFFPYINVRLKFIIERI